MGGVAYATHLNYDGSFANQQTQKYTAKGKTAKVKVTRMGVNLWTQQHTKTPNASGAK
jgi:hypothetical protein